MKKYMFAGGLISIFFAQDSMPFMRIGHRGACGYAPENTLTSFKKAIELGVDAIELDVYRTAPSNANPSGNLVVIHDKTLDRTTNGTGPVEVKTLAELKQYTIDGDEHIPTLEEVLDLVNRRVIINIELKGKNTAKLVATLIDRYVAEKKWHYSDFIVSSFNHDELRTFKKYAPQVKVGVLYEGSVVPLAAFKKRGDWDIIAVSKKSITPEYVKQAHARNLKIFVHTVNKPEEIAAIKAMGVDGIFSDYPDRL